MKTIVDNASNLSKYIFNDNTAVELVADQINIGDPSNLTLIIADMNSQNATLYENVNNVPEDWQGCKYTFDGTTWAQDSGWVEPE